ncbi:hypothetical protein [uncultured Psychroserpens sp.]|uniref:hypothetical protein n=1 Tax=uncultured Psychroserpens sp. TaxID=255436 RepID=UPI0026124073|nr:hypothetical protein [uncultured Psychroserpens sp.]
MTKTPGFTEGKLIAFDILTNGKKIRDTIEITAIEIEQEVNLNDQAYITINDERDDNKSFKVTNSETFKLDTNIEIKLGYDYAQFSVFKGTIHGQLLTNSTESDFLNIICKTNDIRPIDEDFSKAPVLQIDYEQDVIAYELLLHKDNLTQIEGFVSFKGYANTNVNDTLILKNFGDKFNKIYRITKVIHHISNGDWITTANMISQP